MSALASSRASQSADTLKAVALRADSLTTDSVRPLHFYEKGFIGKLYHYFGDANRERPDKKFDITFIGGPHYSSEEGFGIGVAGSGRYRAGKGTAKDTPYSNVTLKGDITTGQMFKIGAEGYHIFPGDNYRINYDSYFYTFKDKYWGIGYDENHRNSSMTHYRRLQSSIKADFVINNHRGVFFGILANFAYVHARDFDTDSLLHGESKRTFNTGLGVTFYLDTRDITTAATRGVYLRVDGMTYPSAFGNKYAFSLVETDFSVYRRIWKGGIFAGNFHTRLTWGNTPWCLLSTFGDKTMRGYWEGRYRDRMEADITLELRQHVWRRNGIVLWVGAGEVFPKFSAFRTSHILPNFGLGYRWEFKKGVNVRLDLGFGRGEKGINFSLNEAF